MPAPTLITAKTRARTIRSVALAALLAGVSFAAADAATRIGWVWADQPESAVAYTPSTSYSYNSAGGAVTITPSGPGTYFVSFAGMGSNINDTALVTAYETNGYCQVGGWGGSSGGPQSITVYCFDAAGVPANSYFDLVYQAHSGDLGTSAKGLAFLWANNESSPAYTPSTNYQYNSTGATNTMTRTSTGVYQARLPGLDKVGGHVQVTAYGAAAARCKTTGWGSDIAGTTVGVACFDATGAPADQQFTLEYSRHLPTAFLTTATTSGVYAWASQPANPSYFTSASYSYNGFSTGKLTAVRDGKGLYHVDFADPFTYSTSNVLVTAYGPDNSYCNSDGWTPLHVACFKQGGAPLNSQFDVSYQTH